MNQAQDMNREQQARAEFFHQLHAGAAAAATTSAGMALVAARAAPYVGMGDGPVAQLLARPQQGREIALTTRNGVAPVAADPAAQPAWRRLFASMLSERRGTG